MQTETQRGQRPRVSRFPAVVLIALATLAFAVLATRPLGGKPQPSFFVIGSARPGVQIGQIAPGTAEAGSGRLALVDLDGNPVELGDFDGHPIWVIFWKTACQPCEAEASDVAAAYAAHRAGGLVLLGIDGWDTAAAARDYVKEHRLAYRIAIDSSSGFRDAFGVWGAPTHYFIGSDGIIRDRYFGPMTADLIEESLARIVPR
jgi:peroxiredoxin